LSADLKLYQGIAESDGSTYYLVKRGQYLITQINRVAIVTAFGLPRGYVISDKYLITNISFETQMNKNYKEYLHPSILEF
jgi:hypothetical protein